MDIRQVTQFSDTVFQAFRNKQRERGNHGCNCGNCQQEGPQFVDTV